MSLLSFEITDLCIQMVTSILRAGGYDFESKNTKVSAYCITLEFTNFSVFFNYLWSGVN